MSRKLYCVGNYYDYLPWLLDMGINVSNSLSDSSVIFFAGGEDISNELYAENKGKYLFCNSQRDKDELDIFNKSKKNQLKIGVCRGGQFLNVANGYKLIQHMNHPSYHNVHTYDNEVLVASSTHHNQFTLIPHNLNKPSKASLIAWTNKLSRFHLNGDNIDYNFSKDYKEPEIVLYEHNEYGKSISIQMHPEFFELNHHTIKWLQKFVKSHI